jgi:hypothetical protein
VASYTLTTAAFPDGTSVSAYPTAGASPPWSGTAVSTGTVASGQVTFSGLSTNVSYAAYASVSGVDTVVHFTPQLSPAGNSPAANAQAVRRAAIGVPVGVHVAHGGALSNGTDTGINTRVSHTAPCDVGGLRIGVGGWYGTETDLPNTASNQITATWAIEYPSGTYHPVYFGGQRTIVVTPGSPLAVSDVIGMDVIPSGTQFWVRAYLSALAAGGKWVNTIACNAANGEGFTTGTSQTDRTLLALVSPTTVGQIPSCNVLLAGAVPASQPSVAMLGDSILDGWRGVGNSLDQNWLTVALNNTMGVAWLTRTGGAGYQANGVTMRRRQVVAQLCSTLVDGYGTNDINLGQTLAQTQASKLFVARAASLRAQRVFWHTIPAGFATSTDNFLTVGNQTVQANHSVRVAFNAWLRDGCPIDTSSIINTTVGGPVTLSTYAPAAVGATGATIARCNVYGVTGTLTAAAAGPTHPVYGVIELSDIMESSRDSGKWKVLGITGTADTTNASATLANAPLTLANGHAVNGTGIPVGSYVLSGGGTASPTLSQAATATASGVTVTASYTADGTHPAPIVDALYAAAVPVSQFA